MAIYLAADTHGHINISKINTKNFPEQRELTKKDYLIILGDFGLIWDKSKRQEYLLNELNNRNFTTLWIDGNHENFDLLNKYEVEEWNGGKIHKIKDSIIHLMRGQVFNIDGLTFFTFGGAMSIDIIERIPNIDYWYEETASFAEIEEGISNLEKYNNKVDYILTHTCSSSSLEKIAELQNFYIQEYDSNNKFFEFIKNQVEYKHWYYGHFHIDRNINEKETALYKDIVYLV